jgi:hypothetical protein
MAYPARFTPEEAMSPRSLRRLPAELQVGSTSVNYKLALIRLLSGTLNIRCNLQNKVIKQRINYSHLLSSRNTRISSNIIKLAIQPYGLKDLSSHLKSYSRNRVFYKELFIEFSNYFLRRSQNSQVAAFLHLYRILESIAYCFPLFWAAKASDYFGTFNKLKTYFNDPKTGELMFFKRFIDDIMDQPLLDTQVTINIYSIHQDWQKKYFSTIYNNIDGSDIVSFNNYTDITVKCHCLIDLVIKLRNQYFHFLSGKGNNYNSEDIAESNEFFGLINEIITNWLAVIYFEILNHEMNS